LDPDAGQIIDSKEKEVENQGSALE